MVNLYHDTAEPSVETAPLDAHVRADVVVIGAGFTGLSTTLHLAQRRTRVVLLEAQAPGFGASGRNGGQVNPGLKPDPDVVERDFGTELGARMNAFAGGAPAFVFDLIKRHAIRCDARQNGTLRVAMRPRQAAQVRSIGEQLARRGAPIALLDGAAIEQMTGTRRYVAAMFDRRGGDVNPLSLARGLTRAALLAGAAIHGRSRALTLSKVSGGWLVRTATGSVTASRVVLATNGYTDDLWPNLRRTIVPVFGAIAASEPLSEALARAVMPSRAVLYETGAVTTYYRVDSNQRLLIGGRGPQVEVEGPAAIPQLPAYARKLWPALRQTAWTHGWGGQLAMTGNHYPHIHEPYPDVLICLGYNGRGVAMGTAMGAMLAERIVNGAAAFDMPITDAKSIRLHGFWRLGVQAAILRARLSDFLGI
jgi:glycine/D-amino acid oxidase-like deaminating enzyme